MSGPTFKKLAESELNPAQLKIYQGLMAGPRGGVRGPFNALLRSPVLCDRVQSVGEFLRFESSIPARLNEFAILITARYWTSQYEWFAHYPLAIKAGLAESVAADLKAGRRPAAMQADEALVYDLCMELSTTHLVSDATFKRARAIFSEQQVVDLIAVSGTYVTVAMMLEAGREPAPGGATPLSR